MYRTQLLLECSYYGVDHLAEKLQGWTSVWDLRHCDRLLKQGADELIDVFAVDVVARPPCELELPLLSWDCQDRPSITCGGAQGFASRMDRKVHGSLADLSHIPGILIAGGAVTAALTGQHSNDVDIFLTGNPSEAEQKLRDVFHAIVAAAHRSDPNARFLVLRSSCAVSVYTLDGSSRIGAPIQIITSVFESTLAVLEDFDLDCCCFAYDVSTQKVVFLESLLKRFCRSQRARDRLNQPASLCQVITTQRGRRALGFGTIALDSDREGPVPPICDRSRKRIIR